jgi:hypothetical protein
MPEQAAVAAERKRIRDGLAGAKARHESALDAAVQAVAATIRAEERERLAQLATEVGATYRSTYSFTEGQSKVLRFADLIREDPA